MHYGIDNFRPKNRSIADLFLANYKHSIETYSKNYRLFANTISPIIQAQIKAVPVAKKFSMSDAISLWNQIDSIKHLDNYIQMCYSIYWTAKDCLFFDKFYKLISSMRNEAVRNFLSAIMVEVLIEQSIFGRFNVSTEGYMSEKEDLTRDRFLEIVRNFRKQATEGPGAMTSCSSMQEFLRHIDIVGILYYEVPKRNYFEDYHTIFDIFENYGNNHFSDNNPLHMSDYMKNKVSGGIYKGDRFIKTWARMLPTILNRISFEYFVVKFSGDMEIEKTWLQNKLTEYGPVDLIANKLLVFKKIKITE